MDSPIGISKKFHCNGLQELPIIVKNLVDFSDGISLWLFVGNLGAGKTTLIKEICTFMRVKDEVSSPSFAIVNEYSTQTNTPIYHIDCYRLKSVNEAVDIGMTEYLDSGNYCFVEWPQVIEPLLPDKLMLIDITQLGKEERTYKVTKYE